MGQILVITLPIYAVIAIGFATVRARLFSAADMQVLGRYVVNIALPALLFHATATRDFHEILHPGYIALLAWATFVFLGSFIPLIDHYALSAALMSGSWTLGAAANQFFLNGFFHRYLRHRRRIGHA